MHILLLPNIETFYNLCIEEAVVLPDLYYFYYQLYQLVTGGRSQKPQPVQGVNP